MTVPTDHIQVAPPGLMSDAEVHAAVLKANTTVGGNSAFHNFNNDFAHVSDPAERRRLALAEIDKAPFGWYHVRACAIAGIGFYTDSYDIFTIGLVTSMLGIVYFGGILPAEADTAIKAATFAGVIIGQVSFGILADVVGRKSMYGLELIIIIVVTLAQALSSNSPGMSIVGLMIFWRVIMGIGIGGDYPLSATITSEFATTKWRGFMMNAVFAMQGIGQLSAALLLLVVTAGFKSSLVGSENHTICSQSWGCTSAVDKMWRIMIGMGAVPGCVALYFRLTMPETPRYTFVVAARNAAQMTEDPEAFRRAKWPEAEADEAGRVPTMLPAPVAEPEVPKASWADFGQHYRKWKNLKVLLGTALSWFCIVSLYATLQLGALANPSMKKKKNVGSYGVWLNNPIILHAIGWSGNSNMYSHFYDTAVGNIILVLAGAVPGYWVSAAIIDTVGRKPVQLFGFLMLTLTFCIMGFSFWNLSGNALMVLYTITQFFFNAGPNSTTFIIPAEVFPTRYRSTSHGISAATGKVGAILAQCVFGPLRVIGADAEKAKTDPRWSTPWLPHIIQIFALFMLAGFFTTLLLPESARKTLEELGAGDELIDPPSPASSSQTEKGPTDGRRSL
ncbi:inorganic phosphate transporter PHO84 [Apiospora saccharicola]|uniref:Inorganic phosphate transporter PHO84 n=1 Tax=Apiospora saccharicola TaxID=335842 RepID=A0ABR1TJQ1_9PEZI